jgi:lysyl-tRNA synthetase class 1
MTALKDLAREAKAWPFEQARELLTRVEALVAAGRPGERPVVFETGYGPSGLPHIGTFGEVVRTTMVRQAFEVLSAGRFSTRLICVSDDMDGMRKVPDNLPNQEMLEAYLQKPLTAVPDPFGTHSSYGAHMNARLQAFLDSFGFSYEFRSATDLYRSGAYDEMLLRAAQRYDQIMAVMLPTLGPERRATYSPFLPISPTTGRVLYVPMTHVDAQQGCVRFIDEDGREVELPVTGGAVKLQWKPDFGMRWAALGVDFEMFGKDHQANAPVYSKICRVLGAEPPHQFVYELFLDENGEKISKSKGNGISVEQWLAYAPQESLSLYQFQKPKTAKKLYFDVIPKAVDEYLTFLEKFHQETPQAQLENPVWHIHGGRPPAETSPVSFAMLLNLVSAANAGTKDVLWGFIARHSPGADAQTYPLLDRLAGYALAYYEDFVKPAKVYRAPGEKERGALEDLAGRLEAHQGPDDAETLQSLVFKVGTDHAFDPLRSWFSAIYEVTLGQSQGPRFGGFIALYGVSRTAELIRSALSR